MAIAVEELTRPALPIMIRKHAWVPDGLRARLRDYQPRTDLGRIVRDCFSMLPAEQAGELLDAITRSVVIESKIACLVYRNDPETGRCLAIEDYGVTSRKVVTTAGVGFLVDAWQNILELETMKYHGLGTGATAEAAADTALVTELTTQYSPDNTRATGSLTEGASANIFRTVGTNTLDAAATIAEHGLFSATTAGTLWDRSLTGSIALGANDSLQVTYDCTCSAGG